MLEGKRVLITGGTGFVGRCLEDEISLSEPNCDLWIASRSPTNLHFGSHIVWDLMSRELPTIEVDVIIHAATPASAELNAYNPVNMFWANVRSMENVIRYAESLSTPPIVLFTSSGGVYGEMPSGQTRFSEDNLVAPSTLNVRSAYAQGKRSAEFLLSEASARGVCEGIIARLFAFSGVHLPLNRHFAIGNFVRDAVKDVPILVHGDGTAIRSYLDGSDMAHWLLKAIEIGHEPFPYHIGSPEEISIGDLAQLVAARAEIVLGNSTSVEIIGETRVVDGVNRYVPDTTKTQASLGVGPTCSLESSIDAMLRTAFAKIGDT